MPKSPPAKPVLYVHAKGHGQITRHSVQKLLDSGLQVCSRLEYPGLKQTEYGYDQPGLLIAEMAGLFPGRPILFMRTGLQPSMQLLDSLTGLLEQIDQDVALTLLSNADVRVNPFAGLKPPAEGLECDPAELVGLLAPGQLHRLNTWVDHFVLLSSGLINRLQGGNLTDNLIQQLQSAGGSLRVPDHLFLPDPENKLYTAQKLDPHESPCPPPFSELGSRLQQWFNAGITKLPFTTESDDPATLHITHSWGGGVAQWLKSFIETNHTQRNFQLRSEDPQSGLGYGQKISLYAGNELRCPIASWWLTPPIDSVSDSNSGYQKILSEIGERYNIGRVFVSSLVGHSLDALRSGRPTVQILHDHFPVWPLLSVNPLPYIREAGTPDLELAIQEHAKTLEFPDKDAHAWSQIRESYVHTLEKYKVGIASPGETVLDLQRQLEPAFKTLQTRVIPHGFPDIENLQPVSARPRKDGRRRLLILGRMQTGKGQQLLSSALPELTRHVQVYLVGAGKAGEAFFGVAGVDVILEYKRDELASILDEIGPDFAALLSIVPETFSFTLSELQKMHIPVIATRVGSFPNRIEHGKTGWLVDTEPQGLIRQVAELCDSPEQIESVRANLAGIRATTLEEMLNAFNELCPPIRREHSFIPVDANLDQTQQAAAEYQHAMGVTRLNQAKKQQTELKKEVTKRTDWALDTSRQLKQEQIRNKAWVESLNSEINRLNEEINRLNEKVKDLAILTSDFQRVEAQNTLILNSSSWKITRPLRVGRRAAKNFMLARAWNPARWPWLFSQFVRNLSTLGVSGTIQRLQYTGPEASPEPQPVYVAEAIGEVQAPTDFPMTENPHVSIVIPVYNKWNYTAACLHSLLEFKGKYTFEVIVVDDQSSDETAEQLAGIKGLTHLRNDENLGFVGSCNRGARHARGEYLVLLNNDTQVLDGWLDELIDTFAREPRAGLVGARLVYPDGSLQESGGIIFKDGSGWNYGREQQAENPEYLYLREADYCSGACITLKTKYFLDLGAFDERYAPAYYEDTDLAFRVRESGFKVLVQPLSTIIHHEGITSGTDTSSGAKKYQLVNQQKFLERWQDELRSQPDKISNPDDRAEILRASQHRIKGRILIIDATTPEPDKDSGSVRLTNLMQCCRDLGYGVTFFADNRDYNGTYSRDLQKSGIEVLYHPWLESLHDFFRDRGSEFDYVFISRHYIAINYVSLLKRYCPEAQFIFDTVDLHYLREQRLADLEQSLPLKRVAQQTRSAELSVIKEADATLVVSTVEKTVLKEDAPGQMVHVLSNIHEVPGRDKEFAERKDIYFVGGYQHPPNVDAACWFVNDIWPLIHQQLPEMRFHLIGSKAPERIRSLGGDGVVFHGFVETLDPFLSDCRLAVAPLRYGAGVKGKVNMSMAHGQPVVATPAAVEGMFAEHERELLVANDAESFAAEVVRLYQDEDLWNRLSDASVQNVEEHFSLATARASLTELFDAFKNRTE